MICEMVSIVVFDVKVDFSWSNGYIYLLYIFYILNLFYRDILII